MQQDLFTCEAGTKQHTFQVPNLVTKQLKIAVGPHGRKLRVSSNFLPMMGFSPDRRISVVPSINGVEVSFDARGSQKIYRRGYAQRKNNPTEAVLELSSAAVMAQFPAYVQRFHVEMRPGRIVLRQLLERAFSARQALRRLANPATMFAAMTSGVDLHAARQLGFDIAGMVEYRPQEARDKSNLTETGAVTACANNVIGAVFMEDIFSLDWSRVSDLLDLPHVPVLHASLQCDSFSRLAPKAYQACSMDTTRDMFVPLLDGIKRLEPAVVVLEQVEGFASSAEWEILSLQLRRLGYYIEAKVMDARDYGGYTSRRRFYAVASLFPGVRLPQSSARRATPIWDDVVAPHLKECRDVTNSKSIQDGARNGRLRIITPEKTYGNTPVKSQDRMTKDAVVIEHAGRFLMPSEQLLKALLSIPQDFDTNVVGASVASEIIGQSIEYGLHHQVMQCVKDHILENVGHCTVSAVRQSLMD